MSKGYADMSREQLLTRIAELETEVKGLTAVSEELSDELHIHTVRVKTAEEMASLYLWRYDVDDEVYYLPDEAFYVYDFLLENRFPARDYLAIVHPDDKMMFWDKLVNLATLATDHFEHRVVVNGRTKYLGTKIIRRFTAENGHLFVEGYIEDMTRIAERRNELENVKYAVNTAHEEIYAFMEDGTLFFANRMVLERYRLAGGLSEHKIQEINPIYGPEKLKELVCMIRGNNGMYELSTEHVLPNGKVLPMEISLYMIKSAEGNDVVWAFSRDISVRVAKDRKIRELSKIMQSILDFAPMYLFVKDTSDFRFLYWNKAFETYSQISADRAIGRTDFDIFPQHDAAKFRRDDLAMIESGKNVETEETFTSESGEVRTIKTVKALIANEDKPPLIIGVSLDITDQKRAQQELIDARLKAEHSDRLKSAFLANMSHEIRTPLNAIVGFTRIIAETDDAEDKKHFSEIVEENSTLLMQLINDILDMSKIEAGTLEFTRAPVSIKELCNRVCEIHQQHMALGVRLDLEDALPELHTDTDANRLSQVLSNLITNASKFTKKGYIRIGYVLRGDKIEFYVEDTGSGIPEEKLGAIFDRFTKLNSYMVGTGLGLSICKMIVEKLGGDISVISTEGKGSKFTFTIEYNPVDAVIAGVDTMKNAVMAENNEMFTILVAEDVDSNFQLLQALIGRKYKLLRAYNGQEAIDMFKEHNPDMILMDVKMPVMNGIDATKAIRQISASIPIIALTAFAFNDDRTQLLEAGCNDYLTKPVAADLLRNTINRFLVGE